METIWRAAFADFLLKALIESVKAVCRRRSRRLHVNKSRRFRQPMPRLSFGEMPGLTMLVVARFLNFSDWLRCGERRHAHECNSTFEPFPPAFHRQRCGCRQKAR